MTMTTPAHFTLSDYERLPEGYPAQLIEGTLVKEPSPTPWHQHVVIRLTKALLESVGVRRVLVSPIDLVLDDENVFQPDLVVFARPVAFGPDDRWIEMPILVIEVLSVSTAGRDRGIKASRYLAAGVQEVWLVDPLARTVEIRTATGAVVNGPEEPAVSGAVPEFSVDVDALLRV